MHDASSGDRNQLTLSICAPFGEYELELETNSYSEASSVQGRTSWEVLDGADEVSSSIVLLRNNVHDHFTDMRSGSLLRRRALRCQQSPPYTLARWVLN